jgi:flagellar hook-length control protein FliK
LLSVTPEAAANAAFQAAPQWSSRSDQSSANGLFGTLVNENAAYGQAAPGPVPRRADETPPANNLAATAYNAPGEPANNDPNNNNANAGPSNANAAGVGNANSGQASGSATQPSATTSNPSKSGSIKPIDKQSGEDTSTADATILAQQAGLTATTPIPIAVVVPVTNLPSNVPSAAPSSGGSTAPLAIAAAAIAASSQPPVTPGPVKTDSTASPATTAKTAAPAPQNAAGATSAAQQATPASVSTAALTLTSTVPATAPVTQKAAPAKSTATTASTDGDATASGSSDPSTTNAPAGAAQNGLLQQASTAGKPGAASLAAEGATGDSAAAPAVSVREHSPAANAVHALADSPDPGAQVGTLQPSLNSTASATPSGALTVTAATHGPVPLNGLALEIAASIKSGKSRFEIRLDPADLGRIDVRIDIDRNGQVTSHLTVEKPETLSLLRQDAPQLQRALDDAGLKTGSGGLQFSLRDQSSSNQHSGSDSSSNTQRLVISEEDAAPAAVAGRTYGRSPGSSSGVDIKV